MDLDHSTHSVTIPLMPGHHGDMSRYLDICKRIGADRVFLFTPLDNICRAPADVKKQYGSDGILKAFPHQESCDLPSLELYEAWSRVYQQHAARFQEIGIEAAYWVGETIGHGGAISATISPFQQLTGPYGQETNGCNCPLDENFLEYMEQVFEIIARSGAPLILLDDDFRLNYHMPGVPVGCFCPLHIDSFNQKYGFRFTREELVRQVFAEKPGSVRSMWFDHAAESVLHLARRIEQAVHRVNPSARLGIATAMTHWSNEGYEMADLLRALCGNTRPFLRTYGSPYRSGGQLTHIGRITEFSMMQLEKLQDLDVEVLAEGDTYPHTRYFCPEQMLDSYQKSLCALGFPGILSYPVTFSASAGYEIGYVNTMERNRSHYQAVKDFFAGSFGDIGVKPLWRANHIRQMDFQQDESFRWFSWPDEPVSAYFLSRMGVPLNHFSSHCVTMVTGFQLHGIADQPLEAILSQGVVLDAIAAQELIRRGIDIGISDLVLENGPRFEYYSDPAFSGTGLGENIWLLSSDPHLFYRAKLKKNARVLSWFRGDACGSYPATVLYENSRGQRFMIYCFDFMLAEKNGCQLLFNYVRQEQFTRCVAWLGRKSLPVTMNGYPDLHLICKINPAGHYAVGIHNTHLDPIVNPVLRIASSVPIPEKIKLLLPDATLTSETSDYSLQKKEDYCELRIKTTVPSMGLLGVML